MMTPSLWIFVLVAIAITSPLASPLAGSRRSRRKESNVAQRNSSRGGATPALPPTSAANANGSLDRCGNVRLKAMRVIARGVTHKHDDNEKYFYSYFHQLLDGGLRVSAADFREEVEADICRKCTHVRSYLRALRTCGKNTAGFARHTSLQYNKVRSLLVTWARRRGFYSVGEMCRCGAYRVDSEHCKRGGDARSSSRKSARGRHVVSWKVVRQCRHFATLECGSRIVNQSTGHSRGVECGLWTNHTNGLFTDVENTFGFHDLPREPDFAKDPWHRNNSRVNDDDDEENEEDLQHHTSSLLLLKCVTGVAVAGFAIILGLYVHHKRRQLVIGKMHGSSASVSTTLTDTGEYYNTKSPLDSWTGPSPASNQPADDSDDEVKKITKHGWHNPVYDVMEEAGAPTDGPESEL